MEQTVLQRIIVIQESKNLSLLAFCKRIGIAQQTLHSAISRNGDIKSSTIIAVLTEFADISAEWLLRGEGEMIRQKNDEKTINITNVHRSVTGDNITGSMVSKQDQEELNRLRQQLTNKEEQLAEKDARIKELTDTIIKMALK